MRGKLSFDIIFADNSICGETQAERQSEIEKYLQRLAEMLHDDIVTDNTNSGFNSPVSIRHAVEVE